MTSTFGKTYLPALKGRIGKWAFYTTLMKFSEVNSRISLSNEIYKNKGLSDLIQRSIESSRAKAISEYLRSEKERFFPAMVVAVFEGAPNWLEISINSSSHQTDFDSSLLDLAKLDSFGLLELSGNEKLFPLDGQHRLAGIREALSNHSPDVDQISNDEVTVMLVAHEASESGRIRSRRLFTVLNKRAVPVRKHQTIALDEDDVMAIATRHIVEDFHPLSKNEIVSYRTNANISPADNSTFTTIITLYDMITNVFRALSKRSSYDLKSNRPNEIWLPVYLKAATTFFELLLKHFPVIESCLTSKKPSKIISKQRHSEGGHILFRPVGQNIFSELVSFYIKATWKYGYERAKFDPDLVLRETNECLSNAFNTFRDFPTDLAMKPYANLIWIPETKKMEINRKSIVRDIILMRYDLLSATKESDKLNIRLRRALGESVSIRNFIWK